MEQRNLLIPLSSCFLFLLALTPVSGQSLFENSRAIIDLSSRFSAKIDGDGESFTHFVGLDTHNLFSDEKGDWATYVGQIDWSLTTRMLKLNVNLLGRIIDGAPNVRVGHYEIPFGLDHLINTNGTLHNFKNLAGIPKSRIP